MRDLKAPKTGRIKKNRRKKERQPRDYGKLLRRLLRISVCAVTITLVFGGGLVLGRMVFTSEFFRVATINVAGNSRVSRQEILGLSELHPGLSIFGIDLQRIGERIEENPWVAQAEVERSFPRQVFISVREHEARAIINLGYLYYVDGEGNIFKALEAEDKLDYPVLSGIKRDFLLAQPEEARRQLREAMALLDKLSKRQRFNLDDVSELRIDQVDGIELYTYVGGVPIRLGFGDYDAKLDRLERIYRDLAPRLMALKYIDLNVVDRIIVKLETGRSQGNG